MRLFELTRPKSITLAKEVLRRAGYEPLGEGTFGTVFGKSDANIVLKLFSVDDTAFVAFLEMVRHHQDNPHFPKVGARTVKVTDEYYAVKIEILNPLTTEQEAWHALRMADSYLDVLSDSFETIIADMTPTMLQVYGKVIGYLKDNPQFAEACRLIDMLLKKGFMRDLHSDNVMLRGRTLVFTDPIWTGKHPPK